MGEHLAHDIGKRFAREVVDLDPACTDHGFCRVRNARDKYRKLQRKMREHVADRAWYAPPPRARQRWRRVQRQRAVEIVRPGASRNFHHGSEQALFRPAAQHDLGAIAQCDEGRAAPKPPLPLWGFARKRFLIAAPACGAFSVPWTERTCRAL